MSKISRGEAGLFLLEAIDSAKEFIVEGEYGLAIKKLSNAIEQAGEYRNFFAKEYLIAYRELSLVYRKKGDSYNAVAEIRKAEDFCRKIIFTTDESAEWEGELAICYVNEGIIFEAMGDYQNSINCYETALSIFKKNNDTEKVLKLILTMILSFRETDNYDKMQQLFDEADRIISSNQGLEGFIPVFEDIKNKIKEEDGYDN